MLPGFIKAATTPGFAGVFENPTLIEGLYNYGLFFTFFVAGLVVAEKVGRTKLHYLNPVPIREIQERWISKYA